MNRISGISALALLAGLAACGSPEQSADEQTPATEMTMDGPYAASEMAMDRAMKAAVGVDVVDTWVRKMIAHHEGAIAMSRVVLGLQPTADAARMAQVTIDQQGAEIVALRKLVRTGAADPASARPYEASMAAMHEGMMAASGATPSETYLRKMLAHHRGAVTMSDVALANGATGSVRAQIEETRAEQLAEIATVEAMLRGEPMPTTTPATQAPASPEVTTAPARRAPAAKPVAEPAESAPEPAPTETAVDPHAGHDMDSM